MKQRFARLPLVTAALLAFGPGCFDTRVVPLDGGRQDSATTDGVGTPGTGGRIGTGGRGGTGVGTGGAPGSGGSGGTAAGSGGVSGTGGRAGTGGGGGVIGSGGTGTGGRGTGGAATGGAATGGRGTGGTGTGGTATGGRGTGGTGTGGTATGGRGTGGAATGGAGTGGAGTGGAGTGGAGTGGAGTGGAGTGGAGTGGAGVLLFKEDFEDGDTVGWTLAFPQHYTFSLMPGTGASGTTRSLLLTKSMDSVYCCEGFYQPFSPGFQPRTVSYWIRSEQTGPVVGTFRLNSTTNASDWIMYTDFSGSSIVLHAAVAAPGVPYVAGRWYHVELRDIDWVAHTFRYFVDGVQIGSTMAMATAAASIARIDMFSNRSTTATQPVVYFDEIELWQ